MGLASYCFTEILHKSTPMVRQKTTVFMTSVIGETTSITTWGVGILVTKVDLGKFLVSLCRKAFSLGKFKHCRILEYEY